MRTPAAPALLIEHAHLLDADRNQPDGWVLADATGILRLGVGPAPEAVAGSGAEAPGSLPAPEAVAGLQRIDAGGCVLTPGLIDMHTHGGGGGSFDAGGEEIRTALRATARHGVTRTMLSLVTDAPEVLDARLQEIAALAAAGGDTVGTGAGAGAGAAGAGTGAGTGTGAGILGVHLEGPFISPDKAGAHAPELMIAPTPELIARFAESAGGLLRYLTIAPELPGALEAISWAADHGILSGVGHTVADYATARAAFDAGATILTHAFNAMPGIHHRAPGPILAALEDERVCIELILDGVHVAEPVAALLWQAAGDRLALITDAMSAAGFRDGEYRLGSLAVTVAGGIAHLTGTDTIAGSTLTLDAAVRRGARLGRGGWAGFGSADSGGAGFRSADSGGDGFGSADSGGDDRGASAGGAGSGLQAAVTAATAAPARSLGIAQRHGTLAPGQAADFVLWDDRMRVARVWRDSCEITGEN